ncbi:MAG: nucleotidyltransferase domain-containing protein [Deltaproteobacteria bacterium]|nr:nucleotidyltransferase domain-containing protein [Deltaproteobacteria bacterium]
MIDLPADQLAQVKAILSQHVPAAEVRVFGSRAAGTPKKYSDLDLAIVDRERLSLNTLGALREAFQESDLPIRVDVVDWHALSDEFKTVIAAHYVVL